jgi:hypothetical protein
MESMQANRFRKGMDHAKLPCNSRVFNAEDVVAGVHWRRV